MHQLKILLPFILCSSLVEAKELGSSTMLNGTAHPTINQTDIPMSNTSISSPTNETSSDVMTVTREKFNITDAGPQENDYEEIEIAPQYRQAFAKQVGLPSNPWGLLINRVPCTCDHGVCGCCTGMFISALKSVGCLNLTYVPEDFSFEFKMIMNDAVLYKNRVTGRNPPPVCVRPPRFNFIKMCASFYDLYFIGRNMHVCLDMTASFQDYEIFNRSFDCVRMGDKGVKIVGPEDGGGLIHKPGTDADIDAGFDPIDEYDENVK